LHTIDALECIGSPVIIASRKAPAELGDFLPGLRSRLAGGLVVALSPPSAVSRCELVERMAAARGVRFEAGAVEYLAESIVGPVAELQGAVSELIATAELAKSIASGSTASGSAGNESNDSPVEAKQHEIGLQQVHEYCQARRVRRQPAV